MRPDAFADRAVTGLTTLARRGGWIVVALLLTPSGAAGAVDRAVVALSRADGSVYIGWRLLAGDRADLAFDIYRTTASPDPRAIQLISRDIRSSCNLNDPDPPATGARYAVSVAGDPPPPLESFAAPVPPPHESGVPTPIRIPLQGSYRAQKVGLADLDGDGRIDYLVKQPDFNTDPYQQPGYWKRSEDTYKLEAYRHDGTFLWRYDMGWAIEEGIWYSPVVVDDLDGDGRAEVYAKVGEGDPREPTGHVMAGPEFLVKLDGRSGRILQRVPWPDREGFRDYNRWSRNLMGVAFLDGAHPSLVVIRGTYGLIKVQTYDGHLKPGWSWEASGEDAAHRGQGMHGFHAADLDGDGRDELVLGSTVLDDNGRPLWSTFKGHPDICYVADIDPGLPGLEVFYGLETRQPSNAVCVVEGRTGRVIWGCPEPTVHVHSQGLLGDIIPEHPGRELYAGEAKGGTNHWLYTARGQRLSDLSLGDLAPRALHWLDGATQVFVLKNRILRWPHEEVGQIEGKIVAIADFLGDWREEIVTTVDGEILIYTTSILTDRRRPWLMQDRLYRNDVAVQTMGYFQPPQLSAPLFP